jgi:hypothetical protein
MTHIVRILIALSLLCVGYWPGVRAGVAQRVRSSPRPFLSPCRVPELESGA